MADSCRKIVVCPISTDTTIKAIATITSQLEEQGREQARLVSNTEVIKELVHLCGERSAKLLLYQLKTRYGIDISEDEPPCSLQTLYRALSETLGSSLAASITCKLYPETRRATCIRRIES